MWWSECCSMIYLLQQVAILNASVFQIHWTVLIYAQANWLTCCGQHAITGGDEARAMAWILDLAHLHGGVISNGSMLQSTGHRHDMAPEQTCTWCPSVAFRKPCQAYKVLRWFATEQRHCTIQVDPLHPSPSNPLHAFFLANVFSFLFLCNSFTV